MTDFPAVRERLDDLKQKNVVARIWNKDHTVWKPETKEITNRLGWINTKTPEQTEIQLRKILPEKYWDDFNHLFVKFGQTICIPISPFCSKCPIKKYCKQISVTRSR